MSTNIKFYKINLVFKLLDQCATAKQTLLDELIICATDNVLVKRRLRMLYQITQYEAQILEKIYKYDTNNFNELVESWPVIQQEINNVCNRSA